MKIEKLKKHEGQIVVLDLIMGKEITTRITSVNTDVDTVTCSKPRMFVPVPDPHNPNNTNIMALHYGYPMYQADEELEVDANHIFTLFVPSAEHTDAYAQKTSTIVTAPAGALNALPQFDASGKFQG